MCGGVSGACTMASSPFDCCGQCFWSHITDQQVRLERATAPVLKDDLRLDRDPVISTIQCLYETRIFFGHKPTPSQLSTALEHIGRHAQNKKVAYENILWALLNTKEFVFNE